jgi:hypothetical protein
VVLRRAALTTMLWATRCIQAAGTSGIRPSRAVTSSLMNTSWQTSEDASGSRVSDRV